jgi:hypothetical protein
MKFGGPIVNIVTNCVRNVAVIQQLQNLRLGEDLRLCVTSEFNINRMNVDVGFSWNHANIPYNCNNILLYSYIYIRNIYIYIFLGATAPGGPGPPHCQGFTITLRHTTLGRTPLDE